MPIGDEDYGPVPGFLQQAADDPTCPADIKPAILGLMDKVKKARSHKRTSDT